MLPAFFAALTGAVISWRLLRFRRQPTAAFSLAARATLNLQARHSSAVRLERPQQSAAKVV